MSETMLNHFVDDMSDIDNCSVKVAVRIRPLVPSEISRGSQDILEVYPNIQQIRVKDTEKAFTYNYVFDSHTTQEHFYNTCMTNMIDNLFKGYNVTVLAYGQTGSGKTHSMGTTYNGESDMGLIPRAVHEIFNFVNDNFAYDFSISVSFMELYQEILYDLLANKSRDQCTVEIREDTKSIIIPGLTEEPVKSAFETLTCLTRGSQKRATGSTNMNAQSSRSHAIFTLNISMQKKGDSNLNKTAKFHLVDLAGSERSKKTGATGVTFKEGVNINKGLLALGNVISALGDEKQQGYIGYRDSNLTRLLKDSLGGNSITLMIACVSPADYNLDESISTLRYADRARRIKNKPVVNQDPKAAEINRLNKLVQQLRLELVGQGGPIICQSELESLKKENETLKTKNHQISTQFASTLNEYAALSERVMLMQSANERLTDKLQSLKEDYNITLTNLNLSVDNNDINVLKEQMTKLESMKLQLEDINCEQKKNEEEIRKHESSHTGISSSNGELTSEIEFTEKQESHTLEQIRLNTELQQVTKMLAMKQHLAQQIESNTYHMVDYSAITENQAKVESLQKEKDELLEQLKSLQSNQGSNKAAELRRKRVQELEKEIHDLHKKISEQARLIKLKERDEEKIKKLNSEIQQMKQTKIKLVKVMRQESEKFRTWKLQREREVQKLKDQDRKRQNQIVKMENMYTKQQTVLKRKVEEAAAISKRLKDVLALRKNVHNQKFAGKLERIAPWLQQEIDVLENAKAAEVTLKALLDDRATLYAQKEAVMEQSDVDKNEVIELEDEIQLRSSQIQELQQKLMDADQEERSRTRWDAIQSMAEAKYALKTLTDIHTEGVQKAIDQQNTLNEATKNIEELAYRTKELEEKIEHMSKQYANDSSVMQKEYEEKISVLLKQLRGVKVEGTAEEFQEICAIQEKAREKIEEDLKDLQEKHNHLQQEKKRLEEKLQKIEAPPSNNKITSTKRSGSNSTVTSEVMIPDSDVSFDTDDVSKDPDWKKTPLGKRIVKLRNSSMVPVLDKPERLTNKRSYDGSCSCKGTCSTRTCGCRKLNLNCGTLCKCVGTTCQNRKENSENIEEVVEVANKLDDFEPPKKPRYRRERKGLFLLND